MLQKAGGIPHHVNHQFVQYELKQINTSVLMETFGYHFTVHEQDNELFFWRQNRN